MLAVNTLVMFEIIYLFNSCYIRDSVLNWHRPGGNRYVLIAIMILILFQLAITYSGPMQSLFGTTAIESEIGLRILLVSFSALFWLSWKSIL